MIAASVVVLASAVAFALAGVPDVCKLRHGLWLLLVYLFQEVLINRSTVAAYPVFVQGQGILQKAFVAGHDVGEVSEGLRCVAFCSDVDVDSAASGVVALGTGFSQATDKLLQGFDVTVGQDRGDQFAFLAVGSGDADILLHLPFAALLVPGAPGFVAVAACSVFVPSGSEELCRNPRCLLAGDAVHFNLDPDGLLLHFLNLLCYLVVHTVISLSCKALPFLFVCTYSL